MARPGRLPQRIALPFGYVVAVKLVTRAEMAKAGGEGCDGLWLVDTRSILVVRTLPARRKRYILAHELGHAWLDWQHFVEDAA